MGLRSVVKGMSDESYHVFFSGNRKSNQTKSTVAPWAQSSGESWAPGGMRVCMRLGYAYLRVCIGDIGWPTRYRKEDARPHTLLTDVGASVQTHKPAGTVYDVQLLMQVKFWLE